MKTCSCGITATNHCPIHGDECASDIDEPTPPLTPRPEAETPTPETDETVRNARSGQGDYWEKMAAWLHPKCQELERQRDQAIAERNTFKILSDERGKELKAQGSSSYVEVQKPVVSWRSLGTTLRPNATRSGRRWRT